MKNYSIIIAILLLSSTACINKKKDLVITPKSYLQIEQLQWLVGNWTNITEKEQSFENWVKSNDSTLTAHSYTLVKNDTVFAERVTLQQLDENQVAFTVVAYQQNNNQPVTFMLTSTKNKVFTFENPKHDFPSLIAYTNPVKDSIHAWIEGKINGNSRKVDFYFKKK
ncbi:MAG: DUF6265 family protein [Oceanihabitans sp.]